MNADELMEFGKIIEEKTKEDPYKALLAGVLVLMEATGNFAKMHNRIGAKGAKSIELTDEYRKLYSEMMEASQIMAVNLFYSGTNAADVFLKSQGYHWADNGDIVRSN